MTKLFGFFRARGNQRARLVRVEATGLMSREELRSKLVAISARKSRVHANLHVAREASKDEQPPSRTRIGKSRRSAVRSVAA